MVGRMWETLGENCSSCRCSQKLKQPEGEFEGSRGCKENREPRESRVENFVSYYHRVPVPAALRDLPDPSL